MVMSDLDDNLMIMSDLHDNHMLTSDIHDICIGMSNLLT